MDKLDNPENGLKPQFRNLAKGKKRAKGTARPAVARFLSRESTGSNASQSPLQGLPDGIYELCEAEGGSILRGETPLSFFLMAGLPEVGLQREVSIEGESDFFRERSIAWKESDEPAAERAGLGEELGRGQVVIELPEAEMPALESVEGLLNQVMDIDVPIVEERSVHYVEEEPPEGELEEPPNSWERDSENGDEAAGEARGQERPAQTATVEERMEAYLRVATPDIPALFPRPALSLSLKPGADARDLVRTVGIPFSV